MMKIANLKQLLAGDKVLEYGFDQGQLASVGEWFNSKSGAQCRHVWAHGMRIASV